MADKRGSSRLKEQNKRHVIDTATRAKRQKKQLESLENDNFHDDPHFQMDQFLSKKKLPSFSTDSNDSKKRRKSKVGDIFKLRAKRSFQALLEELAAEGKKGEPNYTNAVAKPSNFPNRHFCAVCGYFSKYTCVTCGTRYCCVNCLKTHKDTRCMKWTA